MNSTHDYISLQKLAHLNGVQTAYYDMSHRRRQASPESLLAMIRALGAPLVNNTDILREWRAQRQAHWRRMTEPIVVAWDSGLPRIKIRCPLHEAETSILCYLILENGEEREWSLYNLPIITSDDIDGEKYATLQFTLPAPLPWGYHRLIIELKGKRGEAMVISAPRKAYFPLPENRTHDWGIFAPLYSVYTNNSWGTGDYSTLEALAEWLSLVGGDVLATLPMLASFHDASSNPSPYLPASRLFWNEFYLDIDRVPGLADCQPAQSLLSSALFRKEIKDFRNLPLVDYQHQMALKRRVLEPLCQNFFTSRSTYFEEFQKYLKENQFLEEYAIFRATLEKQGAHWQSWAETLRGGFLKEGDYNEESRKYHLYVQWLANRQMNSLASKMKNNNIKLYLDLPVGVHPESYDVWREKDSFVTGAVAGAPPDTVFTRGQNWEFPPLHPENIRKHGYSYFINTLRHHLQYADILRIDHVMGLHRIFCIPDGMDAGNGLYLRYHADELYAILALESQRHKSIIVGEDMGIVGLP